MTVKITDSCSGCGTCVSECPVRALSLVDTKIAVNNEKCMACGHCFAICPSGSIVFKNHTASEAENYKFESEFDKLLARRRSIRKYKKEPIQKETLQYLVNLAKYCPSAMNSRLTQFKVLNRDTLNKIGKDVAVVLNRPGLTPELQQKMDFVFRGCQNIILALQPLNTTDHQKVDATIALATIEIAAVEKGLGTFWCGFLTGASSLDATLLEKMNIQKGFCIIGSLGIGHLDVNYLRPVLHEDVPIEFE